MKSSARFTNFPFRFSLGGARLFNFLFWSFFALLFHFHTNCWLFFWSFLRSFLRSFLGLRSLFESLFSRLYFLFRVTTFFFLFSFRFFMCFVSLSSFFVYLFYFCYAR